MGDGVGGQAGRREGGMMTAVARAVRTEGKKAKKGGKGAKNVGKEPIKEAAKEPKKGGGFEPEKFTKESIAYRSRLRSSKK